MPFCVEVLLETEPDIAGLRDVVDPLPTAARVDAVLLVPNEVLEVVAVLLFTLAVTLLPVVSPRGPRNTSLLLTAMWPPPCDGLWWMLP